MDEHERSTPEPDEAALLAVATSASDLRAREPA